MERYKLEQDNSDSNYNYSYNKEDAYIRAKKRVDAIKGFYWHLASYIGVNIFLITIIAVNSDGNIWNFGTFSTAFFWGIGLGFHALGVFGKDLFFGKDWENKQIKKYMDKDKRRWE
ncbi:MAG TPA: 2TM domain-containing protein [Flavobacteriaceae bacterium]|nr:2TM domain-containing protein [Flavobacteriaceae bacterium]